MTQTPSKIHFHIDKLVLPGYTPGEQRAFVAALEQELAKSSAGNSAIHASHSAVTIRSDNLRPDALARSLVSSLLPADGNKRGGQG